MILEEACIIVRDMSHTYKNMSQGLLIINGGGLNGIQHLCLRCELWFNDKADKLHIQN